MALAERHAPHELDVETRELPGEQLFQQLGSDTRLDHLHDQPLGIGLGLREREVADHAPHDDAVLDAPRRVAIPGDPQLPRQPAREPRVDAIAIRVEQRARGPVHRGDLVVRGVAPTHPPEEQVDVEAGRAPVERAQLAPAERAHQQHLHPAIERVAVAHPAIHRQVVGSADVWNPVLVARDVERCVVEQSSHARGCNPALAAPAQTGEQAEQREPELIAADRTAAGLG